jgi:large subunit ribosomal protein L13
VTRASPATLRFDRVCAVVIALMIRQLIAAVRKKPGWFTSTCFYHGDARTISDGTLTKFQDLVHWNIRLNLETLNSLDPRRQADCSMNCYQAKAGELAKHWYVIDAQGVVVGRLAAFIAPILMGKHRPTYTPHIDTGDYVVVTNIDKVVFTGQKWRQKTYQRYSGYPGGQREVAAWKLFEQHPTRILELAIGRMMPKNKIGRHMLDKLKLYVGPDHPHQAQCPIPLEPLSGRPIASGAVFATVEAPKAKENGAARTKPASAKPAGQTESRPAIAESSTATKPVSAADTPAEAAE